MSYGISTVKFWVMFIWISTVYATLIPLHSQCGVEHWSPFEYTKTSHQPTTHPIAHLFGPDTGSFVSIGPVIVLHGVGTSEIFAWQQPLWTHWRTPCLASNRGPLCLARTQSFSLPIQVLWKWNLEIFQFLAIEYYFFYVLYWCIIY